MSTWWPKKKGADGENRRSPKPMTLHVPPVIKKFKKPPPSVQQGEMILDGDMQGLLNPMAWENTPSVLKEKFPHWKEASTSLKMQPLAVKDDTCPDEHPFQVSTSFKQPDNTIPYIVMECDTLNSIALKFDSLPGELAHINKKPSLSSFLFPGMVLYVPDPNCYSCPPEILETPKSAPPGLTRSFEEEIVRSQETLRSFSTSSGKKERSPCSHLEVSSEWRTGSTEMMTESNLSVAAKYISDDQGCVHGKLLVSTTALMFQPHAKDPLVQEQRSGEYEILIPLEDITYAAVSKECCLPQSDGKLSSAPAKNPTNQHPQAPVSESATSDAKETSAPNSGDGLNEIVGTGKAMEMEAGNEEARGGLESTASNGGDGLNEIVGTGEKMEVEAGNEEARGGLESTASNGGDGLNEIVGTGKAMEVEVGNEEARGGLESTKETGQNEDETLKESTVEFQIESSEDEVRKSDFESKPIQKSAPESESGGVGSQDDMATGVNHQPSVESNDELFEFIGVPETAPQIATQQSDSAESSNSTDSLFTEPFFIHLRVYSKSGINYMYTPLSKDGIQIPRERDRSPMRHVKSFFCFAIPDRRIDDLVEFVLSRHPKAQSSNLTRPSELEDGSILEIIGAGRRGSEELHFHDDHYSIDPDSWEIFSLRDISNYRTRIDMMEVEKDLPLPNMSDESNLMEEPHQRELVSHLVYEAVGHDWHLIYSSFRDGISLRTLYRNMQNYEDTPTLLLVQENSKTLFGVMTSCRLRISDHFYGTGESFLFKFEDTTLRIFPWTGLNSYFIKGNSDSIGFGSGDGHFGLWLHETLLQGSSYQCSTYDNDCLASKQDFVCSGVEAWGFSKPND